MFEPSFESLGNYECPEWFRDAKFGIWSHWGPQSVPMFGDWYARNMYIQDSEQYLYHVRHYGHPSRFGYKDLCELWKAENFDPDDLMERFYKAGARFFVAQASHHDHFFNYPSGLNRFNSMEVGPRKDICGMWKKSADKFDLPFGLTEHIAASFSWWAVNKGADAYGPYAGVPYDGNDPGYRDFYHDNFEHKGQTEWPWRWLTPNKKFQEYWLNTVKEMIDLFNPDLLYSDSALPFGDVEDTERTGDFDIGLEAVSYLYNKSAGTWGRNRAVYTQKSRVEKIYRVGTLDIEKSQLSGIAKEPWQTDTCIANWFYDARQEYKKPGHIIEMLVDIISKNGTMLLNVVQRPDGTIDEQAKWILDELAGWFSINGDAVYGTRPWRVAGEGLSTVKIDGFCEDQVKWNAGDFRFVTKADKLYAFMMCSQTKDAAVIRSLNEEEQVESVHLMGYGTVRFHQFSGVLTIELPERMPTEYVNAFEIRFVP